MAIQPDLVGTITLTSGSANFTWSGTSLVSANIQPGDQILLPAKAMVLTIATVASATTGTLTDNCPAAAAGSGQTARIRYQSDLSRVAAQTRQLIDMLGGGSLSALAALTGAANKGLHFTGAGTAATHDLTSFMRGVLAAVNAAAARTAIGLGTGDSPTFAAATLESASANGLIVSRTSSAQNSAMEFRSTAGSVFAGHGAAGSFAVKDALTLHTAAWLEAKSDGIYQLDRKLLDAGSNSNGNYIRLADGTQICTNTLAAQSSGAVTWTFPAAFSTTANLLAGGFYVAAGDPHVTNPTLMKYGAQTTTSISFSAVRTDTGSMQTVNARHFAIGRWY